MITGAFIGVSGFLKSSNFINSTGNHPLKMSIIGWDKIVTKKEELKENKWLYIGKEDIGAVDLQLYILKLHNDGALIIRE